MTNKLPTFIKEKILLMPEYKYGVNKVRVLLRDGSKYSGVFVAWGDEVIKVGGSTQIPFDAAEVEEVENDID